MPGKKRNQSLYPVSLNKYSDKIHINQVLQQKWSGIKFKFRGDYMHCTTINQHFN